MRDESLENVSEPRRENQIILTKGMMDLSRNGGNPKFYHMSSLQNPGWLFYIEDSTTQFYRDYNKPFFFGSLLTNQDSMVHVSQGFGSHCYDLKRIIGLATKRSHIWTALGLAS